MKAEVLSSLNLGGDWSALELQLLHNIKESFQHHVVSNATFLAEKLLAERDTEETRLVLGECYFAEAKHNMVYRLLKGCQTPAAKYLFSMAAIRINKFENAENTLLSDPACLENGFGYYLIGEAYERSELATKAVGFYRQALEKNPSLWVAFEKLCKLGNTKEASIERTLDLFSDNPVRRVAKATDISPMNVMSKVLEREINKRANTAQTTTNSNPNSLLAGLNAVSNSRSEFGALDSSNELSRGGLGLGIGPSTRSSVAGAKKLTTIPHTGPKDKKENSVSGFGGVSGFFGSQNTNISAQIGQKEMLGLMAQLAVPYQEMLRFNSKKAIDGFKSLSRKQLATGWSMVNIGRCFMDLGDNEKAEEAFQDAFKREPYRVKGVEYYSSCLWQLRKQKELCDLAFRVIEFNQFSPEAWVALGNCFSLQRDHESALSFFRRAIQLDPRFSYAYCLQGHEHMFSDQFSKASSCYQSAMKYDQNNFHAWWGLGNVSLKQEKYERALEYFTKANLLNSKNAVIHSYIGMVYEKMEKNQEALNAYRKSEELNPKALLTRFYKAQIFYKMGDYTNALQELEVLISLSPKEAQLYIMIGNVHKRLGNSQKALSYYMSAQDLENKENQRVKNLIDALTNNNQFGQYEQDLN